MLSRMSLKAWHTTWSCVGDTTEVCTFVCQDVVVFVSDVYIPPGAICEQVGCIERYHAFLPARTMLVSCHKLAEMVRKVKAVEVQQNELLMRGQPPNSVDKRGC